MKLLLKTVGLVVGEKTKDISIKNPNATVANLRAAVAVHLQLSPHSFQLMTVQKGDIQTQVSSLQDPKVETTTTLADVGVKDGSTILVTMKRSREQAEQEKSISAQSVVVHQNSKGAEPTTAASSGTLPTVEIPPQQKPKVESDEPSVGSSSAPPPEPSQPFAQQLQTLLAMGYLRDAAVLALQRHNGDLTQAMQDLRRPAANHNDSAGGENEEQDGEWEDDDDEESDEEGDDEDLDEHEQLMYGLATLPNAVELRNQFLTDPAAALQSIQQSNPGLFDLITRHQELFQHIVQQDPSTWGSMDDIDDEESDEEMDDDGGDVLELDLGQGGDEDEENELSDEALQAIVQEFAAGRAARAAARRRRNNTQGESVRASGTSAGGTAAGETERAPGTTSGPPPPDPSRSHAPRRARPSEGGEQALTEADEEKILTLMQLGFDREQCVAAYLRFRKHVERAANWLLEQGPQP